MNYGNLPLIDIWVAKSQGLSQAQVKRLAGFNKIAENVAGRGRYGNVNVLCDGGGGGYVQTAKDREELARVADMPLPEE
jgi:hypothetical protein